MVTTPRSTPPRSGSKRPLAAPASHHEGRPLAPPGGTGRIAGPTRPSALSRIGLALALVTAAPAAISIQNFTAATNDRFADAPGFTAAAYDWSGVGRSADGKWVTMISANVFLSARHFHPGSPGSGIGQSVLFHPGNDPSDTPVTRTIAGVQQVGGTDLWLGYLSSPVPGTIATYAISTTVLSAGSFGASALANAPAYLSGISPTTGSYGSYPPTNQAVGTNRVEGFQSGVTVSGLTGDVLIMVQNQPGDAGFIHTPYEANLAGGDSGGPLMTLSAGNLVVSGIAWAIGTVDIDPGPGVTNRPAAIHTYTGNYAPAIQDYISLHAVPEPASATLVAMMALLGFRRRRRPVGEPAESTRFAGSE